MSEAKIARLWGEACLRQALLAIFIFLVILIAFVGLVIASVSLPLNSSQRLSLWVGGFILLLLLAIVGILIGASRQARRRAEQLDGAFGTLGLTGRRYLWNGRQYHGVYRSHQVDIYFNRGPTLEIYLASPINTRTGIGMQGRLSRFGSQLVDRPRLVTTDPALQDLAVYPIDEAWGRALLGDPRAISAILHLMKAGASLELRNLIFQPEAIHLQIHHVNPLAITPQSVRAWMDDLFELATIAEALPAPQVTAVATPMERRMRLNRSEFTLPLIGITCGIIGIIAAILIIVSILLLKSGTPSF